MVFLTLVYPGWEMECWILPILFCSIGMDVLDARCFRCARAVPIRVLVLLTFYPNIKRGR